MFGNYLYFALVMEYTFLEIGTRSYSLLIMNLVDWRALLWPLTPKFDMATWPFLKIDMRHRAYRWPEKRLT